MTALRRVPRPLAVLIVAALIETVAWSFAIAPLQGADEAAHVAYVQQLAETGNAPSRDDGRGNVSTEQARFEAHHGLIALTTNVTARPAWTSVDVEERERIDRQPPDEPRDNGSGPNATGQNPPLYYLYEAVPYLAFSGADFATRIEAMRLWSGLLVIPVVVFTWLIAGELFARRRSLQTLATGVVVLHPQIPHVTAMVTADALLAPLWAAAVYVAIRLLRHGLTPGRVVAISSLAAASALTHGRGLALIVPALAAIALAAWRHRAPARQVLLSGGIALGLIGAAVAGTVLLTAAASGSAFGGQIDQTTSADFRVRQLISYVWQFYLPKLGFMTPMIGPPYGYDQVFIRTFFGTFGSLDVRLSETAFDLLKIAAAAGLIALAGALVLQARRVARNWALLALALFPIAALGELHIVGYRELLLGPDPVITGRYLVPLVTLFAIAVAFTIDTLVPRRARPIAIAILLAAGVTLQISALGAAVERFYA